jgi:hypothetical protein
MEAEWKLSTATGTGLVLPLMMFPRGQPCPQLEDKISLSVVKVVIAYGCTYFRELGYYGSPMLIPPTPLPLEPAPTSASVGCSVHIMSCIFSSSSWPCVNQHCTTVNLFWLLTFDLLPVFILGVFFPQPWLYYPPT